MIVSDPAVMMGKPVIAGTRITVEAILEKPHVRRKLIDTLCLNRGASFRIASFGIDRGADSG